MSLLQPAAGTLLHPHLHLHPAGRSPSRAAWMQTLQRWHGHYSLSGPASKSQWLYLNFIFKDMVNHFTSGSLAVKLVGCAI